MIDFKMRKKLSEFKSSDKTRHTVNDVWNIPDLGMVACDGFRLIVWQDETVPKSDKPMVYPDYGKDSVFYNRGLETEVKPPNFKSILPSSEGYKFITTTLPEWLSKVSKNKRPVTAMITSDLSFELRLSHSDASDKIGLDLRLLSPLAGETVTLGFKFDSKGKLDTAHITFKVDDNIHGVLMPMRL